MEPAIRYVVNAGSCFVIAFERSVDGLAEIRLMKSRCRWRE